MLSPHLKYLVRIIGTTSGGRGENEGRLRVERGKIARHMYVRMYVCTYVYMYVCMYVCMYTYIHTYIHTYIRTYIRTYVRTYVLLSYLVLPSIYPRSHPVLRWLSQLFVPGTSNGAKASYPLCVRVRSRVSAVATLHYVPSQREGRHEGQRGTVFVNKFSRIEGSKRKEDKRTEGRWG